MSGRSASWPPARPVRPETEKGHEEFPQFSRNAGTPGKTRLIDGLPAAVDAKGNVYLINYKSRQNQIVVAREEGKSELGRMDNDQASRRYPGRRHTLHFVCER